MVSDAERIEDLIEAELNTSKLRMVARRAVYALECDCAIQSDDEFAVACNYCDALAEIRRILEGDSDA